MNKDDLQKKLENLDRPQLSQLQHQLQLKLSILSAKRSAWIALWLLLIPFIILAGAAIKSFFNIDIPPWSWLQKYSDRIPLNLRIAIFVTTVMVFPLIAVILNVLSITWLQYDKQQKILNISIRIKTINLIIIIVSGLLAFLFIGHAIADYIAGAD